jgi:hypothetical protein
MNQNRPTYFEIKDGPNQFKLEPIELIYPEAKLDWDRNWLRVKTDGKAVFFSGNYKADLKP